MPFVPGCDVDLFISYGHSDDAPPSEHWIRDLTANVEGKLRQICSADVTVWRDPQLMAGDRLNATIQHAIERSAVFVSVLTPVFARQPWCARETQWFVDALAREDLRLDAKSRIIPVEKYPIDEAIIPRAIPPDTLRQRFYAPGAEGAPPREYSNDQRMDSYPQFKAACNDLAHAINSALQMIRRAREQRPVQARQRSVFIAAVGGDVRQYRDAVAVELSDRGFGVTAPSLSIEDTDEQATAKIVESASVCDVALHIAGESRMRIGDDPLPLAQFAIVTREAVKRPPRKPVRRIVWVPSDDPTRIETVRRTFVAAVANIDGDALEFEVLGGSIASLKEALLDIAAAPPEIERSPAPVPAVFLLCQRDDLRDPQLRALRSWLVANDWVAELPPFQGDVGMLTTLEERNIIEADATVIFYGHAEDWWVREKRRAIQQAWAKADSSTPRHRAIYLSAPADEFKDVQYRLLPKPALREKDAFPALLILGDCGSFDQEKLRPLVERFADRPGPDGP
jgi:hypothetical protein